MSATKDWLHDYNQRLDAAWEAFEEAIITMAALNDTLYTEEGDIRAHCPRADVSLLAAKLQELQGEFSTMENAREPRPSLLAAIIA